MILDHPELDIHRVDPGGAISLVSANVPYNTLQWTRKLATCGQFEALLDCELPVPFPGRYIVTASGMDEVGIIEKVSASEAASDSSVSVSGRFAESIWDRYQLDAGGATVRGADWRQAVTLACSSWHMPDVPAIALGAGTAAQTGQGYALSGGEGDSAMEAIYARTEANGAYPLLTYDRATDTGFVLEIREGLDRTRDQTENPIAVFSLGMGSASMMGYNGDYSVACSEVIAYASKEQDGVTTAVRRVVAVPGFDQASAWRARAFEDVSSLLDQDDVPTAGLVDASGLLRTYDHMPSIAIDGTVYGDGYRSWWDLGDLCEVEMPSIGLSARERVEEVRIVANPSGVTVEGTLGTKQISKLMRAAKR